MRQTAASWPDDPAASGEPPAQPGRRDFGRWATGALAAALAGPGPARAAEPGALTVWYTIPGLPGMRRVAERFEQRTGVRCVAEAPEDMALKFRRAASAGKGPDVFVYAHDQLGEWIAGGLLRPVSPSRRVRADTHPLGLQAFSVGGRLWGYPFNIDSVGLIYNKALVSTPPATFEEVFALDRRLAAQGRKALLWDYTNPYFSWPLLAAQGAYAFKARPDGSFDAADTGAATEGAIRGAEMLLRLIREGVMPEGSGYAEMEAAMGRGQVAMMINGPWAWDNLRKAGIDFGVAKVPGFGGRPAAPFVGVRGAMINRASPNVELAVEFIENHLLTPEGLSTINAAQAIGVPASAAYYAQLRSDPRIETLLASAQDGHIMPSLPEMGRFFASMTSALSNLTQGRQTPRDALEAAARRIVQR